MTPNVQISRALLAVGCSELLGNYRLCPSRPINRRNCLNCSISPPLVEVVLCGCEVEAEHRSCLAAVCLVRFWDYKEHKIRLAGIDAPERKQEEKSARKEIGGDSKI